MANRKPLTDEEKIIIKDKAPAYADAEIARMLNRPVRTISHYRKKVLGLEPVKFEPGDPLDMDDARRMKFFKKHLENHHFWDQIKDQLTDQEMDFYMSEWASLCIQFQDIVATERRQIHDLIMAEILSYRTLKNIKFIREEIEQAALRIEVFRATHNIDDDTDAAERDNELTNLVAMMVNEVKYIGNQYEAQIKQKNSILECLNGRRRDRISQIKEAKENLVGFIESLKDKRVRQSMARYAVAHRDATIKLEKDWQKNPITFPDGTKDTILKTLNE